MFLPAFKYHFGAYDHDVLYQKSRVTKKIYSINVIVFFATQQKPKAADFLDEDIALPEAGSGRKAAIGSTIPETKAGYCLFGWKQKLNPEGSTTPKA